MDYMSEDRPSELAYDADDEDDGMCNLSQSQLSIVSSLDHVIFIYCLGHIIAMNINKVVEKLLEDVVDIEQELGRTLFPIRAKLNRLLVSFKKLHGDWLA